MKEYWLLVLGYNLNLLFGLSLGEIVLNQIFSRKFFVVITKIIWLIKFFQKEMELVTRLPKILENNFKMDLLLLAED